MLTSLALCKVAWSWLWQSEGGNTGMLLVAAVWWLNRDDEEIVVVVLLCWPCSMLWCFC